MQNVFEYREVQRRYQSSLFVQAGELLLETRPPKLNIILPLTASIEGFRTSKLIDFLNTREDLIHTQDNLSSIGFYMLSVKYQAASGKNLTYTIFLHIKMINKTKLYQFFSYINFMCTV